MEQLKKCPFCGGETKIQKHKKRGYYVICTYCGCRTPFFEHPFFLKKKLQECAITAWNTRKPMERYEELESKLQSVYGECDGLLETVVDGLVKHEGVEFEKPMRARLLTDEDVDKWDKLKGAMERIMERLEKVKNREANGECPIDGMCDKKPYECTSCYSNTAIEIVREEM